MPVWVLEQGRRLGFTDAELLDNYPSLTRGDLAAAWAYVERHSAEIEAVIHQNKEA